MRFAFVVVAAFSWSACGVFAKPDVTTAQLEEDIARLVKVASKLDKAWPWQAPIPEIEAVAAHGKAAGPLLASQLKFYSHLQGADEWDLHAEQQVALALCQIYAVQPESGHTVYGIRSNDKANESVRSFWRTTVGLPK